MLKLFGLLVIAVAVQASNLYGQQSQYPPAMVDYPPMATLVYPTYGALPPKCDVRIDYSSVPGSCRKFRRCSNGYLYIFRCPDHLVWDVKAKTCSFKSQVPPPCGTLKPIPVYPLYSNVQYQQPPAQYPVYTVPTTTTKAPVYPSYPVYTAPTTTTKAPVYPSYPVYTAPTTTTKAPVYPSYPAQTY